MIGVGEGKVLLVLPALLGAAGVVPAGMGYALFWALVSSVAGAYCSAVGSLILIMGKDTPPVSMRREVVIALLKVSVAFPFGFFISLGFALIHGQMHPFYIGMIGFCGGLMGLALRPMIKRKLDKMFGNDAEN